MSYAVQHPYDPAAEEISGARDRIVDVRGMRLHPPVTPVLADPTGVRARRLARAGRVVAALCLLWLVGLGLAGIGIVPAGDLPLGHVITAGAPGVPRVAPRPAPRRFDPAAARATSPGNGTGAAERVVHTRSRAPATLDARPGMSPHASGSRATGRSRAHSITPRTGPGLSRGLSGPHGTTTPSETVAGPTGATSGPSQTAAAGASTRGSHGTGRGTATAPGMTVRATTPGHTSTSARGGSGAAPGRVVPTTATAPGKSDSSPGHTMTSGGGHGNGT